MLRSGPSPNPHYYHYTQGEVSFIDFSIATDPDPTAAATTGRHLRLLNVETAADAFYAFLLRVSALVFAVIHSLRSLFLSSSFFSISRRGKMSFLGKNRMNMSASCSLPSTMGGSSDDLPSSNTASSFAIPPHFMRRGGSHPSSRQSSYISSRSMSASSFFKKLLVIPKFKSRHSNMNDNQTPFYNHTGQTIDIQTSVVSFTTVDDQEYPVDGSPASSATEVDSDCEMVEYVSDSDDSPTTLREPSPFPTKLAPSPSPSSFLNPFSASEPILAPPTALASSPALSITPITPLSPPPKKKTPRRNPHPVQDLSDFIATRRTSALMCPPPSPGYSSPSFQPSPNTATGQARRRSSCKGSFFYSQRDSGMMTGSPYRKYCFATEDSRHDASYAPSPKRTSYGAGETQVASLPIPPWRRYRKAPPAGDLESQRAS